MRRFRFSLGSLVLFVLLLGSIATVWVRRKPWAVTREWKAHEGSTACVLSMDHGDKLLTLGNGSDSSRENPKNELKVWDAQTGALLTAQTIEMDGDVDGAVFSPDENQLVVCCRWRSGSHGPAGPTVLFQRNGLSFSRVGCLWSAYNGELKDQFKDDDEFRKWIDKRNWQKEPGTQGLYPVTARPSKIQFRDDKIYTHWSYFDLAAPRLQGVFDTRTRRACSGFLPGDGISLWSLSRNRSCAECYQDSNQQDFIADLQSFKPLMKIPTEFYCNELLDCHRMLASDGRTLRRFDVSSGAEVWSIPEASNQLSISSDETRFLRATNDWGAVYEIRDLSSGALLCTLEPRYEDISFDTKTNRLLSRDLGKEDMVRIRERRFPEWWWGHLLRPEVWALIACAGICARQIVMHFLRMRRSEVLFSPQRR